MLPISFKTNPMPLHELLNQAQSGKLQLPDFQRGWVWDDANIQGLLTSVAQSFPVGALMSLETGGEVRFKPRLIEGVEKAGTSEQPQYLLLDGQQRITSLFLATMQKHVIDTRNAQKRAIQRWYYLDMQKALDPSAAAEEVVVGVPNNKQRKANASRDVLDLSSSEQEFKNLHFPTNAVFDDWQWHKEYQKFWAFDEERLEFYNTFKDKVIKAFELYQLPVITLSKETPREAVCLIFEKVNTGGKKLDAFELLTAIYATDKFDLRADWYGDEGFEGRKQHLSQFDCLKQVASTDFLQAVALVYSYTHAEMSVSCTRKSVLELPLEAYQEWREAVTEGFVRAAKFLTMHNIFRYGDVPYRTQLVPLAAILTTLGNRADQEPVRDKVAKWYWCGVFGELYGSAVETRFARDLPEVIAWLDDGELPSTVREANFVPDRLHTLRTRQSAAYKGVHILLMRKGALEFKSAQKHSFSVYFNEDVDIHHIFPKKWCGDQTPSIPPAEFDCIVNKTPIAASTNQEIGGKAPSIYLKDLEQKYKIDPARMDEILSSHLVDPSHLRQDQFSAFFAARKESLLVLIEEATGRQIPRDAVEDEHMGSLVLDLDNPTEDAE